MDDDESSSSLAKNNENEEQLVPEETMLDVAHGVMFAPGKIHSYIKY